MIRKVLKEDLKYINEKIEFFNENKINLYDITEHPFSKYYVYVNNQNIIGFINYSIYYDRAELNYIWVKEEYRNKKIASKMMEYMLEECENLKNITLEVRADNLAIKLYKKYDFKKVAIRKMYYGKEDAILMLREMI